MYIIRDNYGEIKGIMQNEEEAEKYCVINECYCDSIEILQLTEEQKNAKLVNRFNVNFYYDFNEEKLVLKNNFTIQDIGFESKSTEFQVARSVDKKHIIYIKFQIDAENGDEALKLANEYLEKLFEYEKTYGIELYCQKLNEYIKGDEWI